MQTSEAVRILQMTLQGSRPVDEDTHRSMGVLEDRLEQLKIKSTLFHDVSFSEEVERLAGRSAAVAVN